MDETTLRQLIADWTRQARSYRRMAERWCSAAERMTAAEDEAHYCDSRAKSLGACALALTLVLEKQGKVTG